MLRSCFSNLEKRINEKRKFKDERQSKRLRFPVIKKREKTNKHVIYVMLIKISKMAVIFKIWKEKESGEKRKFENACKKNSVQNSLKEVSIKINHRSISMVIREI